MEWATHSPFRPSATVREVQRGPKRESAARHCSSLAAGPSGAARPAFAAIALPSADSGGTLRSCRGAVFGGGAGSNGLVPSGAPSPSCRRSCFVGVPVAMVSRSVAAPDAGRRAWPAR